jgi:fatty acid-binding protein DegV
MTSFALLIDSTTVMPSGFVERFGVTVLPVPIYAGGREYRDGVDISEERFCDLLEALKERPTTAVPGLGEFVSYYEELLGTHDHVVYAVPTVKLTGLFNAAIQAAKQVPDAAVIAVDPPLNWQEEAHVLRSDSPTLEDEIHELRRLEGPTISVVNTGFVSAGIGVIAAQALRAIQEGQPLGDVLRTVIDAKARTGVCFVLSSLEYIVDRIGKLQAFLGTLLHIVPVLAIRDGDIEDVARVRSRGQARKVMIELLQRSVADSPADVFVIHSLVPDEAADFLTQVRAAVQVRHSYVGSVGCSISRYTGRGGLGLAFTRVDPDKPQAAG